jgi:ABC-type cobalamin/Fe3+-siderophores transport system ATPase subunit
MFAGPNGSGKSTLKDILKPEWLGVYINPDDMEKNIRQIGFLNFSDYGLVLEEQEIKLYFFDILILKNFTCYQG